MKLKNRLRNNLIRKLGQLSTDKLNEINELLSKIETQVNSKEKTLGLAGSWNNIDESIFIDLTNNLHSNRANDRSFE
jgi:2'-5' RNA ligase